MNESFAKGQTIPLEDRKMHRLKTILSCCSSSSRGQDVDLKSECGKRFRCEVKN